MYILYQGLGDNQWQAVGYFAEFPQAVCAMEEELKKNDGTAMRIEKEAEKDDGQERTA